MLQINIKSGKSERKSKIATLFFLSNQIFLLNLRQIWRFEDEAPLNKVKRKNLH